jgi:hypothetical protein
MPKVQFVNEHREVEVEAGRLISEIADELGIAVCREEFVGTGVGDYTVWVKGEQDCLSPPTWYERFVKRCRGQRRMANRAKVLKDCSVWTQQGLGTRARAPRPLDPAPRSGEDGSERFDHEHNAAGTTWNVYGHPYAVGKGDREPPKYEAPVKKKKEKKAKPAADAKPKPEPAPKEPEDADAAEGDAEAAADA